MTTENPVIFAEETVMTPYSPQEPHSVTAKRYRSSKYFLDDMLRCSEAVNDFHSVKLMVSQMPAFSLHQKFQFATETIRVD